MSQYEEIIQIVSEITIMSETASFELINYAEGLSRFVSNFSTLVNGSDDPLTKMVCSYFISAEKELYKAAKATLQASKIGHDWCGGTSPTLVLKKVRR